MKSKPQIHNLDLGVADMKLEFTAKEFGTSEETIWGKVDFAKHHMLIYVGKEVTNAIFSNTLLHELVHVSLYLLGMDEDDNIPKSITNEFLTTAISNQLSIIFALNPYLIDLLKIE